MTPAWTMLVIAIIGSWSQDIRMQSVPFNNKEACVRAAKEAASSSSGQMGFVCISSETGESLRFQK